MTLKDFFPDAIVTWTALGALATFLAVLFALFGEKIKMRIWGPRLGISSGNVYPFLRFWPKIMTSLNSPKFVGYYFRLKVANIGHATAHGVYGKLTKLINKNENGKLEIYHPVVFEWFGTKKSKPQNLSPNDYDFLTLGFILQADQNFYIKTDYELEEKALVFQTKSHPFKLFISLYSDDAPTIERKYLLSFDTNKYFAEKNKHISSIIKDIASINIKEI